MIDLEFHEVTKIYRIRQDASQDAGGGLRGAWRRKFGTQKDFVALDAVSFQVPRGETLGIIGHNGAGKSTILKLLSNITTPTKGEIRLHGRLASLLEVGSGFHPELTGRENVFLSGSILGMRRAEIVSKLDAIVDFSEVRAFIDVPVKRYSSGMFVRLGFAIAAHLDPDILLLDEVLAVGDAKFQERCMSRIEDLRRAGTTIVFISHDLTAVQRLCQRVLLMQRGRLIYDGTAEEAVEIYMKAGRFHHSPVNPDALTVSARITGTEILASGRSSGSSFRTGDEFFVRVDFTVESRLSNALVSACFLDYSGQIVCEFSTIKKNQEISPGQHSVEFQCAGLPMGPGLYRLSVALDDLESGLEADWHYDCSTIFVDHGGPALRGLLYVDHSWQLRSANL